MGTASGSSRKPWALGIYLKCWGEFLFFFWNPFDIGFRAMEFRLHLFALVPFEILVNM